MTDTTKSPTYESQFAELETIVKRLDNDKTPIDELAKNVKRGAALILALNTKLTEVETEVLDAFKTLDVATPKPS
jgi:exodeoxyribonuclease VII small subunit